MTIQKATTIAIAKNGRAIALWKAIEKKLMFYLDTPIEDPPTFGSLVVYCALCIPHSIVVALSCY